MSEQQATSVNIKTNVKKLLPTLLIIMGLFSFLTASSAEPSKMKTINYHGGVVVFRIPDSWKEEYSEVDGGTFYENKPDSGTFRLKVMLVHKENEITTDSTIQILNSLKQLKGKGESESNGNALAHYEESTEDQGHKIKIFYWIIVNPIPPSHARIATFSYTILQSQEKDPQIAQQLQMLDQEIRSASFSKETGVEPK